MADTRMDGLPMNPAIPPGPAERPMHDKAVNDGPTTANGPLSRRTETLDDRLISAQFVSEAAAQTARQNLMQAGIAAGAMRIARAAEHAGLAAQGTPADDTLIGRIREAIVPDEPSAAARAAVAADHAVLEVQPTAAEVETVVRIIEQSGPARFDADLERWRNKG